MRIQYEIEGGVLILRMATEGLQTLSGALQAAAHDPRSRPKMPLLIDVTAEAPGLRYQDVRWRVQILAQMREQLAPRWAILTGTGPVRVGIAKMFVIFSHVEGLETGVFADKDTAMRWLRTST